MKHAMGVVVAALALAACATAAPRGANLVGKAVDAMGGEAALASIRTIAVKGTVRQWEPEQSFAAGGQMRYANESTFDSVTELGSRTTRIDWVRHYAYPARRTYTFTEIVTPDAGYVAGIDATARNKQNLESHPPAHAMSGLRLAAAQRELRRMSVAALMVDMLRNPERVAAADDVMIGGRSYPAVNYTAADQTFTVLFDPRGGLPARIRTLDYDNVWGDVAYDLVLADWRVVDGGVRLATSLTYELDGRVVSEIKLTEVRTNVPVAAERITIPAAFKASAPRPATGAVPYQWVIRRQFIGTYLDSDNPSFDTRATSGLRLAELAPGILHVVGGTHNSLIVEMRDHLVVFDAPVSDWQSNWTLGAARRKLGAKPVKYLVLTHHHMDHTGGFRAYAAQGAALVVGKGNGDHFRRALAASARRNPDLPPADLSRVEVVEVADKHVLTDGTREVQIHMIDNPHASGMLIGYVPDARIGFVTDLWSPGRDPLPAKITPPLAAVVAGVKKAGIEPVKFAGGHGSVGEYAPLAELASK